MPIRVTPGHTKALVSHLITEMAAYQERQKEGAQRYQSDICDWAEQHFYIPFGEDGTAGPIRLPLHQKAVLRYFFTRGPNGRFPFKNIIYSSIKKSGKSTIAGMIGRYMAETQTRYGEIFCIGNDLEQAKDRSYKEIMRSLEMTPGYNYHKMQLPGRWNTMKLSLRCLMTGSIIRAIAVDARGEAGGQPALTIWTELWGFESLEAKRFWDEMQPVPTVPDSMRLIETYAGYDGESDLLRGLYDRGMEGHQLTAGELASAVAREGVPGESFQDFVDCWFETGGDPEVHIPIWTNQAAGIGMYWDSGMLARRMPWQHMFRPMDTDQMGRRGFPKEILCAVCFRPKIHHEIDEPADVYYRNAEALGPPQAYRRLHLNEWVGAESAFVPMEAWDACGEVHDIDPLVDGERTPLVVAADAAVTGDCFGIVAVTRCPQDPTCVDVRALKKWDPKESGGIINLEEPEQFLRDVSKTYNVYQIPYDPYQLESIAQRIRRDGAAWMEPFSQAQERLKADSQLYDMIVGRRVHFRHADKCPKGVLCNCWLAPMREHIANSNGKMQKDEDSKLRIVKKAGGKKIDLAVALSMAVYRCLYLRIS